MNTHARAERMGKIPPYLFFRIEARIAELKEAGMDVITLGIGDPDLSTPEFVMKELSRQALDPANHKYPSTQGEPWFREAVSGWMKRRFNVVVDPKTQVCNLIGSKEGIANLARAYTNPGDVILCPDPGYIAYANGATILCDAIPHFMPLKEENGFLPQYDAIPDDVLKKAKLLFVNYPNAPTGAIASEEFIRKTVEFANEHKLVLAYDNAYSEFTFDGYRAPSILQFTENAIEFHTLSKTFCMTGDRVGFAVGNPDIIDALKTVKSNVDSGCPKFIQRAAVAALESYKDASRPPEVEANMLEYQKRRDVLVNELARIGLPTPTPKATFYVWVPIAHTGLSSAAFAEKAIEKGVVVAPGSGFGPNGEGYIRMVLTQPAQRIKEAVSRLEGLW